MTIARTGAQCVRCERWVSELMFEGLCEQCVMCESFAYPKTLCDRCRVEGMYNGMNGATPLT